MNAIPGSVVSCRRLGAAGSVALAVGGWGAGALPAYDSSGLWSAREPLAALAAGALAYAGLVLLAVAWWRLGQLVAEGAELPRRELVLLVLGWAGPLALGPPLFSSDVYSYVAQGVMAALGMDVYHHGPSVLGPALSANVAGMWRNSPAPYGPLFIAVAESAVRVTGRSVVPAVLGMRAVALLGYAVTVWAVRHLAKATGQPRSGAVWAGVLNPLVLVHLVAGTHNEALMIALMLAGFVLARRGRMVLAVAVVTLAVLVKAPAGVALLCIVCWWVSRAGRARLGLRNAVVAVAVSAGTVAVVTLVAGQGFGWISAIRTPTAVHTVLSLTTDIGYVLQFMAGLLHMGDGSSVIPVVQAVGVAAALGIVGYWAWRAPKAGPEYAAGMGLTALVLLAPVVQPWYLLWGLLPLAAVAWRPLTGAVPKLVSVVLLFVVLPTGDGPTTAILVSAIVGVLAAMMVLYARPGTSPVQLGACSYSVLRGGPAEGGWRPMV